MKTTHARMAPAALLTTLALIALPTPAAAGEIDMEDYVLTAGIDTGYTPGAAVFCPAEPCMPFIPYNVGGAFLETPSGRSYVNLVVSSNDYGFWGSQAAISACFYNSQGDMICDSDDIQSGVRCGFTVILGAPFTTNTAGVWIWTLVVTEDLDVCGGSYGSVAGDFW